MESRSPPRKDRSLQDNFVSFARAQAPRKILEHPTGVTNTFFKVNSACWIAASTCPQKNASPLAAIFSERPVVGAQKQVFWGITPHHGCLFIACSLSAHLTYPHNVCFHLAGLIWINPKNFKQTKKNKKNKKNKKTNDLGTT